MNIKFFKTPADLRKWFQKNHLSERELLVGFYKKASGKKSITWPESVDEALCVGWIDGIRKSSDEESYTIRFTPRRTISNWSNVNIKRMAELLEAGIVHEAGRKIFENRDPSKVSSAAYEQGEIKFPSNYEKQFRSNKKAWAYFQSQNNSYKKTATWWVIKAKQEKTQQNRLERLIKDSENGSYIQVLQRPVPRPG